MNKTAGQVLVEGNAAAAMGCMFAGVTVVAWYPITPSSSLPESLIGYMRKYRMDKETGKATFAIVQAEDEIAALGMVIGASWAGARAMTSTSGPGISLMSEFAGLSYYAEVPAVVFDIQRVGPSTGLADADRAGRHPVRRLQLARRHAARAAAAGVGRRVLRDGDGRVRSGRAPADDRLRDERPRPRHEHLDVARRSRIRTKPIDRGKVLDEAKVSELARLVGPIQGRGRRRHSVAVDAGHAGARRSSRAAPATTRWRSTPSGPDDYVKNLDRLARKFDTARTLVPQPIVERDAQAPRSASSRSDRATGRWRSRAISCARRPASQTSYLRLRAYPFTPAVDEFIRRHDRVYVVEQNRDAPDAEPAAHGRRSRDAAPRLRSVLHYNGLPIDARSITDGILAQEGTDTRTCHPIASGLTPRFAYGHDHEARIASTSTSPAIAAARRRSAPGAGTTRSPSASSTRSSRWASIRSAS